MPSLRNFKALKWEREGDCFRCTSHKADTNGYVRIMRNRKLISVSRRILEKRHGNIDGLVARHTCDHPWCIRPDHILLGTFKDNTHDMMSRGRQGSPILFKSGETNPMAKLSESDVKEIRNSTDSQVSIAKKYSVDQTLVSRIRGGKIWRNI